MLDDTDVEILRLLTEDARRPYSEIGERVDLSPPAVSDRVSKLQNHGIIRRFTLDLDRSQLRQGTPVLVTLSVAPDGVERVREALSGLDGVEHVFTTAGGQVVITAHAPTTDVASWVFEHVDSDPIREIDVELLTGADWNLQVDGDTDFALTCVECGNEVGADGVTRRIDGDVKPFCCGSCERLYVQRYEDIAEGAD
ncbi:AsnC family transcriptional regulator [Halalkalicoccus jeotgali]|uniref:Putative AsnC family transcriptional regulator n=1 Tax=Halalkalicoccus jeotgali (strain DSM 18796 / CECT 7217 / JCM 14584 / KCTC 4019 / B3) TaxID=795797 RepID=D8J3X8_HALJB|nr:AsnC family transcriptional regulator [Halalkalicoccus jeotgali]ADJ15370.1 putative transcriptional regulator, AsnC family protein [Halalkalicoccus jeotgali B3]ELY35417.1 putative AsnC family transcriptional regulator [Halalkalicoccus jeotgali B3]